MVEINSDKGITSESKANRNLVKVIAPVLVLVIIGLGILSGYLLFNKFTPKSYNGVVRGEKGEEVGSSNTQVFPDTTVGVLEQGGLNGDGSHKLIREGGPSQTAYLASSVIDLDQFIGRKVQVWGKTYAGQKAAWLMDVGRVKILE